MQIGPKNPAINVLHYMEHMVVVVPVDCDIDETEDVAEKHWNKRHESRQVRIVWHLHFQHHDGDDDGDHSIAECLESSLAHISLVRFGGGYERIKHIGHRTAIWNTLEYSSQRGDEHE